MIQYYSLKQHVQAWLDENNITNVMVIGLGKGARGVTLYINDETTSEFINKYPMLETKFYKGYFTKQKYESIYVSMVKNKDNYGHIRY